jgi:sec-independent protein translocase protein TatB
MFDLSSSKLLILGMVALIVVGPKDLPILLRAIGKYVAMIRRQAAEFRSQFDDAMRESELAQIKKDVETMGADMEKTMRDAELEVEREVSAANAELESALAKAPPAEFSPLGDLGPVETSPAPAQPVPATTSTPAADVSPVKDKVGA